ncbi:MAG: DUF4230 domain-containing protein [Ginsengibacter sp.]
MRKILKKYAVLAVSILLILFLFQKINWLPSFKNIFHSKPVIIEETPVVIQQINTLAQLITITFTDEVVMDTAKIGNGMPSLLPTGIGTMLVPGIDRLVIIGRGKVIAGTDLKNIQEKDVNVVSDSVHVSLPHARILQTIMNPSDFETFDEKGNWNEDAVTALKMKIRNEIGRHAIQQNVLQQADERCRNIIETFLRNTGFKKVAITFIN